MKRVVAFLLLLCMVFSLSAETITHSSFKYRYEEYEEEEFPIWANDLRRGETIFFGSFVFTVPVSALTMGLLQGFGLCSSLTPTESALTTIGGAAVLSLSVSIIDWILGRMEK